MTDEERRKKLLAKVHYEKLLAEDSLFSRNLRAAPLEDIAEIGVGTGRVFVHMAQVAQERVVGLHAFDSFCGMNTPGPRDSQMYPKGQLDVGGVIEFVKRMHAQDIMPNMYKVWPGYIPDCFAEIGEAQKFGFVRIDVDHYRPTLLAAWWAWDRLVPGGCLSFDDWFPNLPSIPATDAIQVFIQEMWGEIKSIEQEGRELFIYKKEGK